MDEAVSTLLPIFHLQKLSARDALLWSRNKSLNYMSLQENQIIGFSPLCAPTQLLY